MTLPAYTQPDTANLVIRRLGCVDYAACWQAMRAFSATRAPSTPDELWLLEHPPVYTMGLKGGLKPPTELHGIPLLYTDRGGDITYHGPGQLVAYALIDLRRRGLGIRQLVSILEQSVIDLLAGCGVEASRRPGAPGVYVQGRKIAAIGLRVKNGASYHGLSSTWIWISHPLRASIPAVIRGSGSPGSPTWVFGWIAQRRRGARQRARAASRL